VVLSRSNLTRLIDRLEDAGLVKRERSEEDRRGAFAVLTDDGKAMRRRMWPVYAKAIKELFEDRVSDAQAQVMGTALRAILDAARAAPSDEAVSSAQPARQQRARKA
jgi:DNA-binding MarR family transcriptional regulator